MKQTIIWFNKQKGFGESTNSKGEVFFFTAYHVKTLPKPQSLKPGTSVVFCRRPNKSA